LRVIMAEGKFHGVKIELRRVSCIVLAYANKLTRRL
jgi:hypothetical protein